MHRGGHAHRIHGPFDKPIGYVVTLQLAQWHQALKGAAHDQRPRGLEPDRNVY